MIINLTLITIYYTCTWILSGKNMILLPEGFVFSNTGLIDFQNQITFLISCLHDLLVPIPLAGYD